MQTLTIDCGGVSSYILFGNMSRSCFRARRSSICKNVLKRDAHYDIDGVQLSLLDPEFCCNTQLIGHIHSTSFNKHYINFRINICKH
jgi:hypothetical protein